MITVSYLALCAAFARLFWILDLSVRYDAEPEDVRNLVYALGVVSVALTAIVIWGLE